jgi:hypothetical protein
LAAAGPSDVQRHFRLAGAPLSGRRTDQYPAGIFVAVTALCSYNLVRNDLLNPQWQVRVVLTPVVPAPAWAGRALFGN